MKDEGVTYKMSKPDDELIAFSNSDFAGDYKTGISTTGFLIVYKEGPRS